MQDSFQPAPLEFAAIQKKYGLTSPEQIQARILWNHLKAITRHLYGDGPDVRANLNKYEDEWIACEKKANELGLERSRDFLLE
jgi:hypothetical protein